MEEHRLKVLENRVVGRTFGLKGNELMGGWRNLHDEELQISTVIGRGTK
jgi:hypothetical protein